MNFKPEIIATFKMTAMESAVRRALNLPVYIYILVSYKTGKRGNIAMERVQI